MKSRKELRKELKAAARKVMKRHYWFFVLVCLVAAVLGAEYSGSLTMLGDKAGEIFGNGQTSSFGAVAGMDNLAEVTYSILSENIDEGSVFSQEIMKQYESEYADGPLGRSRGVLAGVANKITSGNIVVRIAEAINSLVNSTRVTAVLLILLGFSGFFLFWMCMQNIFKAVSRRIFLESRIYEHMTVSRFFYFHDVKKWWQASVSMMVFSLLKILWCFTIVGGVIKRYSYYMVPYIVAENPDISPMKAIRLSQLMMKGHKWECFVMEMSFFGWWCLGIVTFGLSEIFFSTPYRAAAMCEYFVSIRETAFEACGSDAALMNDPYLYEAPFGKVLRRAYGDVLDKEPEPQSVLPPLKGFRGFCADVLGIALFRDDVEEAWQKQQESAIRLEHYEAVLNGQAYPSRLSPLWCPDETKRPDSSHYVRHYSIWSLIVLFFAFSMVGWLWEVCLHLITNGEFVNRGTMHGPWLPIYGGGGVLILTILNKLRRKPAAEFCGIMVLCGIVEYFSSVVLEMLNDGVRWWDYTGYLLNLHGRICAEGLLLFAVGGMAIVYLLAPHLDRAVRKIKLSVLMPLCIIFLMVFSCDAVYSVINPNMGDGITNYSDSGE